MLGDLQRKQLVQSLTLCAALATLLLTAITATAQDVTEPALKAAFIYNFAKFTEWPAEVIPEGEPMVLCVLGDIAISEALEQAVRGRMLAGHSMTVVQAAPVVKPSEGCHLLYISATPAGHAAKVVAAMREEPVLTISDAEGFTQHGGIAQFFFEHGQLRFNIHLESARRARLKLSSRLLALARTK
jgi:hypothetical protein